MVFTIYNYGANQFVTVEALNEVLQQWHNQAEVAEKFRHRLNQATGKLQELEDEIDHLGRKLQSLSESIKNLLDAQRRGEA
jgi:Skp family chaperone for outer membrane proteins